MAEKARASGTNGGYGKGRPRFSDEERKAILARYDAGETGSAIAKDLGCSPNTIYHLLRTTLRHVPLADRYQSVPAVPGDGACIRCGIRMGVPGMCLDCLEVAYGVVHV